MRIIIPTRGRRDRQLTLTNLTPALRKETVLVCPKREKAHLEAMWGTRVCSVVDQPDENMTISQKRKWIIGEMIDEGDVDKIVMLDDDLRFAVRRTDVPKLFRKATPEDMDRAFGELEDKLSPSVPHAGFGVRQLSIEPAALRGGWQDNRRMIYTLGYYLPIVAKEATFGRIETREDMDVELQLLEKGYPCSVNVSFVTDQKWGDRGGCDGQRTVKGSNDDAEKLARLHPGHVRVVDKEYKGVSRKEVVCSWKKCFDDGKQRRDGAAGGHEAGSGRTDRGKVRAPARSPRRARGAGVPR